MAAEDVPLTEEEIRAATVGDLVPHDATIHLADPDPEWPALYEREAARLREAGWEVVNETPLPVVCATHADLREAKESVGAVVREVQRRGRAWVSEVVLAGNHRAVRMCITSFRTSEADLNAVVEELERARQHVHSSSAGGA